MIRQHIQDIELQQLKFNDGDRILVKVSVNLRDFQYKQLEGAVKKFTRAEVRILIVNCFGIRIFTVDTSSRYRTVVDARSDPSLLPFSSYLKANIFYYFAAPSALLEKSWLRP